MPFLECCCSCNDSAHVCFAELPDLAHKHFDVANWRTNAEASYRAYKKNMIDQGSVQPLIMTMSTMFVFNYIFCLPREMAHNQHEEQERFKKT